MILIIAFLYCVVRAKARAEIKTPKKVLVFQTGKLGDAVCTTPMFCAIKRSYPACTVCVMGNKVNGEVLANNENIDNYLVYTKKVFSTIQFLRKEKIDFACLITPNFLALAILYLSKIPTIAIPKIEGGWSPYETKSYRALSRLVIVKPHRMGHYAPHEYLRLLEPLGIYTEDTTKHLAYSSGAGKKIEEFFVAQDIDLERDFLVCISPSAGNRIKSWGGKNFARVIKYVCAEYGAKIILIGAGKDKEDMEETLAALDKNLPIINTFDKISIDELKALMSYMKLFISVDTGPIYIAEAFDVPTIDITGPIDENEQPPIGKKHKAVVPNYRKKPELHVMNARRYNVDEVKKQLDSITVEMVLRAIDELMLVIKQEKI